jgi:hypothetical protein
MNSYKDPKIYSILCYMVIFLGFYIIHRVFIFNDQDNEESKTNEHSN